MWVCYFELDCIYFAVLIVKILEHDYLFCFEFRYCSICWKFVTLCILLLEFIHKTIYHNISFTDLQNGAAMFSIILLIQQSNNHQFISSSFRCLYQILRFSSGLVNKIQWWEARKKVKGKALKQMTDILNDCGWPLCSALNLYLTLCTVSKKSSFFVNCVYCQR